MDKQGIDKVGGCDNRFADHGAYSRRFTVAARPSALLDPDAVGVVARDGGGGAGGGVEGGVGEVGVGVFHGAVDGVGVAGREGGGDAMGGVGGEGGGGGEGEEEEGADDLHGCMMM